MLALILGCHSSYRGVLELLREVLGISISLGTVHTTALPVRACYPPTAGFEPAQKSTDKAVWSRLRGFAKFRSSSASGRWLGCGFACGSRKTHMPPIRMI